MESKHKSTARKPARTKKPKFDGMTKAEQRVAIARDALSWVEAGALVASAGLYFEPSDMAAFLRAPDEAQLRDVVLGKCECCAVGALFAAKAVRFDDVTVEDGYCSNCHEKLKAHFEPNQLALIECAFERGRLGPFYETLSERELSAAISFGERFLDDRRRLTAILRNIIANGGTFRPEVRP